MTDVIFLREREAELRCYWDASLSLNRSRAAGDPVDVIMDLVEELEAIGEYTTWPELRLRCYQTTALARTEVYDRAADA